MKIYLARPITGCDYYEIERYYSLLQKYLRDLGYRTLCPMTGKEYLRNEPELKAHGYQQPPSTNHAIKERDKWMVEMADIVYINFVGTKSVSIGCVAELAWADLLGKHTIIVLENKNVHRHSFVLEMADIVFESHDEALDYLVGLSHGF